jgi:hypothetical protein
MPGIAPDDLKIEVGDTELHIQTSNTNSSQASGFRYRLTLPADVATEAVRTTLVDGQLTVTLPRRTPLPPRQTPRRSPHPCLDPSPNPVRARGPIRALALVQAPCVLEPSPRVGPSASRVRAGALIRVLALSACPRQSPQPRLGPSPSPVPPIPARLPLPAVPVDVGPMPVGPPKSREAVGLASAAHSKFRGLAMILAFVEPRWPSTQPAWRPRVASSTSALPRGGVVGLARRPTACGRRRPTPVRPILAGSMPSAASR